MNDTSTSWTLLSITLMVLAVAISQYKTDKKVEKFDTYLVDHKCHLIADIAPVDSAGGKAKRCYICDDSVMYCGDK